MLIFNSVQYLKKIWCLFPRFFYGRRFATHTPPLPCTVLRCAPLSACLQRDWSQNIYPFPQTTVSAELHFTAIAHRDSVLFCQVSIHVEVPLPVRIRSRLYRNVIGSQLWWGMGRHFKSRTGCLQCKQRKIKVSRSQSLAIPALSRTVIAF